MSNKRRTPEVPSPLVEGAINVLLALIAVGALWAAASYIYSLTLFGAN